MSLATTIVLLICGWLAVAAAMLWGCCALPVGTITPTSNRLHPPSRTRRRCITPSQACN